MTVSRSGNAHDAYFAARKPLLCRFGLHRWHRSQGVAFCRRACGEWYEYVEASRYV